MTPEAYAKIRGMSDAALVCVYRSTFIISSKSTRTLEVVREALLVELRSRPHIPLDDDGFIEGYDSNDGFGTLRRGNDSADSKS